MDKLSAHLIRSVIYSVIFFGGRFLYGGIPKKRNDIDGYADGQSFRIEGWFPKILTIFEQSVIL